MIRRVIVLLLLASIIAVIISMFILLLWLQLPAGIVQSFKQREPLSNSTKNQTIPSNPSPKTKPKEIISQTTVVKKVIDGDTIEIENGQRVRYIGMNTPETVDPRRPVQCFGKEASQKNMELVLGKTVRLEKDISDRDKYGRLLRYVYIMDGENKEIMVNQYLVEQGYAQVSTFPPDIKYVDVFRQAEQTAQENNRGLWNSCPVKK